MYVGDAGIVAIGNVIVARSLSSGPAYVLTMFCTSAGIPIRLDFGNGLMHAGTRQMLTVCKCKNLDRWLHEVI